MLWFRSKSLVATRGFRMEVKASRIQGSLWFAWTKLVFPDRMEFDGSRVRVTKRHMLGLGRREDQIRIGRIASVRVDSGIFNSTIVIETQGGAVGDLRVSVLPKAKAAALADAIKEALPD